MQYAGNLTTTWLKSHSTQFTFTSQHVLHAYFVFIKFLFINVHVVFTVQLVLRDSINLHVIPIRCLQILLDKMWMNLCFRKQKGMSRYHNVQARIAELIYKWRGHSENQHYHTKMPSTLNSKKYLDFSHFIAESQNYSSEKINNNKKQQKQQKQTNIKHKKAHTKPPTHTNK